MGDPGDISPSIRWSPSSRASDASPCQYASTDTSVYTTDNVLYSTYTSVPPKSGGNAHGHGIDGDPVRYIIKSLREAVNESLVEQLTEQRIYLAEWMERLIVTTGSRKTWDHGEPPDDNNDILAKDHMKTLDANGDSAILPSANEIFCAQKPFQIAKPFASHDSGRDTPPLAPAKVNLPRLPLASFSTSKPGSVLSMTSSFEPHNTRSSLRVSATPHDMEGITSTYPNMRASARKGALRTIFKKDNAEHNFIKAKLIEVLENVPKAYKAEDTRSFFGLLAAIVTSKKFEGLCAVVILANAVNFGLSANYLMKYKKDSDTFSIAELSFSVFYTIELVLRLCVYHVRFFCSKDWPWNIFDLALVLVSAYEQVVKLMVDSSSVGNVTVIRTMRILKMFKLLRMFRLLRIFKELRLLLDSILGSMRSMVWSVALVITVSYVFGIVFLQAGTVCMLEDRAVCRGDHFGDSFQEHWGSVQQAMLSLFMAVTGGIDWTLIGDPLIRVGLSYFFAFLFYVAFFNFIVLNTLTSLFLEATLSNAEKDQRMLIQNEIRKKEVHMRRLTELFSRILGGSPDLTEDDFQDISLDDLKDALRDPEMFSFASSMGIDAFDVELFFNILSQDGEHPVDLESFVVGCMKMRGPARSMDLLGLIYSQKKFVKYCDRQFRALSKAITTSSSKLPSFTSSHSRYVKTNTRSSHRLSQGGHSL